MRSIAGFSSKPPVCAVGTVLVVSTRRFHPAGQVSFSEKSPRRHRQRSRDRRERLARRIGPMTANPSSVRVAYLPASAPLSMAAPNRRRDSKSRGLAISEISRSEGKIARRMGQRGRIDPWGAMGTTVLNVLGATTWRAIGRWPGVQTCSRRPVCEGSVARLGGTVARSSGLLLRTHSGIRAGSSVRARSLKWSQESFFFAWCSLHGLRWAWSADPPFRITPPRRWPPTSS